MIVADYPLTRKRRIKHRMTRVNQNRIHAQVNKRVARPPPLNVDYNVENHQQEIRTTRGYERVSKGPQVFIDWHQTVCHVKLSQTKIDEQRNQAPC